MIQEAVTVAKPASVFASLSTADGMLVAGALLAGVLMVNVCTRLFVDAITGKKEGAAKTDIECKEMLEQLNTSIESVVRLCEDNTQRIVQLENKTVDEKTCSARLQGVQTISKMHYRTLQEVQSDVKGLQNDIHELIKWLSSNRRSVIIPKVDLRHTVHSSGCPEETDDDDVA